jgi:hypothetical protein
MTAVRAATLKCVAHIFIGKAASEDDKAQVFLIDNAVIELWGLKWKEANLRLN